MNLHKIERIRIIDPVLGTRLQLKLSFVSDGIKYAFISEVPVGWDAMTRNEKITWAVGAIDAFLTDNILSLDTEVFYPDIIAPETAKIDFDTLPGWASWTAVEASDWIEANVVDLDSAKVVLKSIAKAIIYIRDIVIER
jgi:hypothetical protein